MIGIEEKPAEPKSSLAQTGIYLYDERVFSFMDQLAPSARGELEVTDLNNIYVKESSAGAGCCNRRDRRPITGILPRPPGADLIWAP